MAGEGELFPYDGKPIIAIEITGARSSSKALVASLLDIEPGYLYASDDISRGVRRLYALGRFSDVTVSVEPVEKALILHVEVVEQEQIGDVTLSGDTSEVVRKELKATVQKRQNFDGSVLDALKKRCEKMWATVGYFSARCAVSGMPNDRGRIDVTVESFKGAPSRISAIDFEGDTRIEPVFLLNQIAISQGDIFTESSLREAERSLLAAYFKRGFLTATVRARSERSETNMRLVFTVNGGPRVSLKVKGGLRFPESALRDLLKRQEDEPMSRPILDAWRRAVQEKYQANGFGFAEVRIESFYEASKRIVHHVLSVKENERAEVEAIRFPGAEFFPQQQLRDEIVAITNEILDPSAFSGEINRSAVRALQDGGPLGVPNAPHIVAPSHDHWRYRQDPARIYLPEAYRRAIDALKRLYLEQGFTQVVVGPVSLNTTKEPMVAGQLTPARARVAIDIPIKEGPRAMVHLVAFSGTQAIDSDTLYGFLYRDYARDEAKLTPGSPYSELFVEEIQNEIQKALARKGYQYARVEHTTETSKDGRKVDLRFNITDGPQVLVGRVLVQGNDQTKENIVRDRILLEPGMAYSPDDAQTTRDELTELGAFSTSSVGLTDPEAPAEQKDVLVKLIERDTQSVEAGLGFSTTQGVRGYVEYAERNLFGTGQLFTARLQLNRQFVFTPVFYNRWAPVMDERYRTVFQADARAVLLESIERQIRLAWRTPRALKLPGKPQLYAEAVNERINTIPFSLDTGSVLVGVDLKPSTIINLTLETSLAINALQCFPINASVGDTTAVAEHAALNVDPGVSRVQSGGRFSACDTRNFALGAVVAGGFINWKTGPSFVLDLRDNKYNTTKGILGVVKADVVVGQQFAPSEGQQLPVEPRYSFLKLEAALTGYIPVTKSSQFVLSGRLGNIFRLTGDDSLLRAQLNELFFLGGRSTLRGYADRTVLPEDACVVRQSNTSQTCANPSNRVEYVQKTDGSKVYTPVPGSFYWLLKAEFRFPILGELKGAVFVDTGNLYFSVAAFDPRSIRWNLGAGLRYETGVGQVAFDLGFNPGFRDDRAETVGPFPYFYFGLY